MNQDNEYIQQLLSEARLGSRRSMGRLAVIVRERLYPFVFRTTFDHDLTEDVLQETLLTVVGQVACLREKRKFWPWVFRIAWSKLQDNLRRRRHQSSGKAYVSRASCPRSEGGTPSTQPALDSTALRNTSKLACLPAICRTKVVIDQWKCNLFLN